MKSFLKKFGMMVAWLLSFLSVYAYDFEVDGLYYDIVSISDKTCALTSGDNIYTGVINIPDSVLVNGRYLKVIAINYGTFLKSKELSELTIPSNVTTIDGEVFARGSSIGKLNIPYSPIPLSVGAYADGPYSDSPISSTFKYCNPTEIHLDRELIHIYRESSSGFSSHDSLEKLTIGNHIDHFKAQFFNDCKNLRNLHIEDSDTPLIFDYTRDEAAVLVPQFSSCPLSDVYIGRNFQFYHGLSDDFSPFRGRSIEHLRLGSNVTMLENKAFYGCSKLQSVEFPKIEDIGSKAFYNCKQASFSAFPSSIKNIGSYSFYSCNNILEVVLNCDIENIEEGAFSKCDNLEKVILTGNVKKIYTSAFEDCYCLRYVDLGKSVEHIGTFAFSNASIVEIALPNSVNVVASNAFYNCERLKRLEIGSGIKQIGNGAFNSGIVLDSIVISATTPPVITENAFSSKSYLNCKVVVPSESLELYKANDGWSNFWSIEGGLTSGIHGLIAEEDKIVNTIPHGIQAQCDGLFDIYYIDGKKITTSHLRKGDTLNLSMGLYIVKCSKTTQKIYIR